MTTNPKVVSPQDYPGLPKWPALVVAGDSVAPDDAAEIIIRTTNPHLHTNDKTWLGQIYDVFGLEMDRFSPTTSSVERFCRRVNSLSYKGCGLNYLHNDRIATSYIGGPHGWCNWDGTIFCGSHNIGKWPSVEEVRDEWEIIAAAFPYLKLRAQLFSGETCEEDVVPVIEFVVEGGKVTVVEPQQPELTRPEFDINDISLARWRERGIRLDALKQAYKLTVERHEPALVQLARQAEG